MANENKFYFQPRKLFPQNFMSTSTILHFAGSPEWNNLVTPAQYELCPTYYRYT